jgi:hypothetical protein
LSRELGDSLEVGVVVEDGELGPLRAGGDQQRSQRPAELFSYYNFPVEIYSSATKDGIADEDIEHGRASRD